MPSGINLENSECQLKYVYLNKIHERIFINTSAVLTGLVPCAASLVCAQIFSAATNSFVPLIPAVAIGATVGYFMGKNKLQNVDHDLMQLACRTHGATVRTDKDKFPEIAKDCFLYKKELLTEGNKFQAGCTGALKGTGAAIVLLSETCLFFLANTLLGMASSQGLPGSQSDEYRATFTAIRDAIVISGLAATVLKGLSSSFIEKRLLEEKWIQRTLKPYQLHGAEKHQGV